jgi:hypothetical protein
MILVLNGLAGTEARNCGGGRGELWGEWGREARHLQSGGPRRLGLRLAWSAPP